MAVSAIRSKDGKRVHVISDKFEIAAAALYDSFKQERASAQNKYYKFNADSPFFGYGSKDVEAVSKMNAQLCVANVTMALRLWREGMWECNNYIKSNHFEKDVRVTVKVPKVLDGEWILDEGGKVVGGHASGNVIQMYVDPDEVPDLNKMVEEYQEETDGQEE